MAILSRRRDIDSRRRWHRVLALTSSDCASPLNSERQMERTLLIVACLGIALLFAVFTFGWPIIRSDRLEEQTTVSLQGSEANTLGAAGRNARNHSGMPIGPKRTPAPE